MNQSNQTSLVQRVYDLTLEMEHAAAMANWPEAARLSIVRGPLLMAITADQEPAALDLIRRIQAIDDDVAANAKVSQSELEIEYRAAMNRTQAASQYQRAALF